MSQFIDDQGQASVDGGSLTTQGDTLLDLTRILGPQLLPSPELIVPSSFPTPIGHRLSYDRYSSGFYFVLEDDLSATAMTLGQRQALNSEAEATALTVNAVSGAKTKVFGFVFTESMDISGYYLVTSLATATWVNMEYSNDTTTGFDGTWTPVTTSLPGAFVDGAVNPEYRTRPAALTKCENVKAIRFKSQGGTALALQCIHLFGAPGSSATVNRLKFWDPTADTGAGVDVANFGDAPRRSSADVRFRVKNASATIVSAAVTLSVETLTTAGGAGEPDKQLLLSKDGGRTFAASINIGTLAPGQVSSVIVLRRVTPSTAALGTWAARVYVSGSGGITEGQEYIYFGSVSDNVPTPHVWYVYPPVGVVGTQVEVVGSGFGTSEAQYAGTCKYGGVTQSPVSWVETAAGVDAYNAARAIQAPNNVVKVEHQRVTVLVPNPAVDDYFTVETNA